MQNQDKSKQIFTIGHSNLAIEHFVDLLKQNQVDAIVDIRSTPYSRRFPQFNRENLKRALDLQKIKYVFMGGELGARRDEPECYVNGQVSYQFTAKTETFQQGIKLLLEGVEKLRLSLMCAEKDPLDCHRSILVCRNLKNKNLEINHILSDGSLENHADFELRLLQHFKLPEHDLFKTRNEILDDAYNRQGEKIAFKKEDPVEVEASLK